MEGGRAAAEYVEPGEGDVEGGLWTTGWEWRWEVEGNGGERVVGAEWVGEAVI